MGKALKIIFKVVKIGARLYPVFKQLLTTERGKPMKAQLATLLFKKALMPLITMLLGFARQVGDYFAKGEELPAVWKKAIIAADFLGKLFRVETVESTDTPIDDAALDEAHAFFQDTADEGNFILVTDFPIPKDNNEPIDG